MSSNERTTKVNNNDRRVKRTKKTLRDALFELLKTKSINQITVTELTELADVNRATFYFYYTDIYDMLEQIQNEAYDLFKEVVIYTESTFSDIEGAINYITRFLEFCRDNSTVCKFVINNDSNNQLYRRIQSLLISNVPRSKEIFPITDPRRYLTNYALTAMTGLVIDWMDEGMVIEPRVMAEFMVTVYIKGSAATKKDFSSKVGGDIS